MHARLISMFKTLTDKWSENVQKCIYVISIFMKDIKHQDLMDTEGLGFAIPTPPLIFLFKNKTV